MLIVVGELDLLSGFFWFVKRKIIQNVTFLLTRRGKSTELLCACLSLSVCVRARLPCVNNTDRENSEASASKSRTKPVGCVRDCLSARVRQDPQEPQDPQDPQDPHDPPEFVKITQQNFDLPSIALSSSLHRTTTHSHHAHATTPFL